MKDYMEMMAKQQGEFLSNITNIFSQAIKACCPPPTQPTSAATPGTSQLYAQPTYPPLPSQPSTLQFHPPQPWQSPTMQFQQPPPFSQSPAQQFATTVIPTNTIACSQLGGERQLGSPNAPPPSTPPSTPRSRYTVPDDTE